MAAYGENEGTRNGKPDEQEKMVNQAKSVKERHASLLKGYPNVVGVGVGHEVVGGKRTDRVCIRVYVRRKLPKSQLAPEAVLPDNIDGLAVDVIEDEFWIHQAPPVTLADHRRPHNLLVGGISIGHLLVTAGTLGVLVFDNRTGQEMLLSNWHVFCNSDTCQAGEPIIQPGAFDGGTTNDVVARLIRSQLSPEVDAAIAQPVGQRPCIREVLELGVIAFSSRAVLGMTVRKSGRTTGFTEGIVADVSADVDIGGYPSGKASFRDQIVIEGVRASLGGDSGSVWVDNANQVVGLNFAGSTQNPNLGIANHIEAVMTALDINLGAGITVLDWQTRTATL